MLSVTLLIAAIGILVCLLLAATTNIDSGKNSSVCFVEATEKMIGSTANSVVGVSVVPPDFVSLKDIDPSIYIEQRYSHFHNFVGVPMMGYDVPDTCLLTRQAAMNLSIVQQGLLRRNPPLSLKVYDCYRPQMSVDQFVLWSSNPDVLMKAEFYPLLDKGTDLFPTYIAKKSGHSRGSTMDLTIVLHPAPSQEKYVRGMALKPCFAPLGERFGDNSIEMGTGFDCFSPIAHTNSTQIPVQAIMNRKLLVAVMEAANFVNYPDEWWHFTLKDEPYPDTYFDFPITNP